jgi:hypothetical protein
MTGDSNGETGYANEMSQPAPGVRVSAAVPASPKTTAPDGLKSEALRAALGTALTGKPAALEAMLCRYGAGPHLRPNLKLAVALGAEIAQMPGPIARLLTRLGGNDAAPDTPEVFLPVAAAYGWAARLAAGLDQREAWSALAALAADERAPVRLGTREALIAYAMRPEGADALLGIATEWLENPQREDRYGTAGVVLEVLSDRRVLAALDDHDALFDYLSRALAEIAEAPRAAERSDGRRRLLLSLPGAFAAVVVAHRAADRGPEWLETACIAARHPDVRGALSDAILSLRQEQQGQGVALIQRLRAALEGSAKPPRDPTLRRPSIGRGRDSRRMK